MRYTVEVDKYKNVRWYKEGTKILHRDKEKLASGQVPASERDVYFEFAQQEAELAMRDLHDSAAKSNPNR